MPAVKTGRDFTCEFCGVLFYRRGSHIKRGITKSCGATECKSKAMMGEKNPFWGSGHSQEVLDKIAATKRARPRRKTGPPIGYKHTPQAKAKMTAALKERWATLRDFMLAARAKGVDTYWKTAIPRHRTNFTRLQRADWVGTNCSWCDSPDDLVLDHIIPVVAGGKRERYNAQTLCRTCNLWKMAYVDRPLYLAMLGSQGGRS